MTENWEMTYNWENFIVRIYERYLHKVFLFHFQRIHPKFIPNLSKLIYLRQKYNCIRENMNVFYFKVCQNNACDV